MLTTDIRRVAENIMLTVIMIMTPMAMAMAIMMKKKTRSGHTRIHKTVEQKIHKNNQEPFVKRNGNEEEKRE